MKTISSLLLVGLMFPAIIQAVKETENPIVPQGKEVQSKTSTKDPDISSYEGRRLWILRNMKGAKLKRTGWHDAPGALARLWNDKDDSYAINYLSTMMDHKRAGKADVFMMAHAIGLCWSSFSQAQRDSILKDLEQLNERLPPQQEIDLEGHGRENSLKSKGRDFDNRYSHCRLCDPLSAHLVRGSKIAFLSGRCRRAAFA